MVIFLVVKTDFLVDECLNHNLVAYHLLAADLAGNCPFSGQFLLWAKLEAAAFYGVYIFWKVFL